MFIGNSKDKRSTQLRSLTCYLEYTLIKDLVILLLTLMAKAVLEKFIVKIFKY